MSDYTKSTNFATKDNLTPGDPLKIVRGTEIDTEFNNIATAIATKTDNASAAITGGSITGITDLAIADGGTGASTATAAINNLLPSQTSNANKYLQTDGTNVSWDAVSLSTADITGTLPVANGGTGVTSSTGTGSVVLSNSPTLVTPTLGTPASGTLTNATGLPISTGVSGLGTGVATFLGTPSSANLASAVSDETGSGALVFANSPTLVTPALGTPSSATLTNATGLPISTGVSGLGTGVATFLATPSSANLRSALTDETGSGSAVFAISPALVTPDLGTPSAATLTNATGLPISTGVSGLGTGVATALAVNVGSAGAPVVNGGALGTPSSGTVTNLTGTASININGTVGATTPTTGAFTTLSASSSVTLSGGTANGVTYLNGSKVLTSGSALTFDGANLSVVGSYAVNQTNLFEINNGQSGGTKFASGVSLTSDSGGNYTSAFYIASGSNTRYNLITGSPTIVSFYSANSEQMRLTSTGLGIGTSSPAYKLDVNGSANITSYLRIGSTPATGGDIRLPNTGIIAGRNAANSSNRIMLQMDSSDSVLLQEGSVTINSSGNLGLGVTPSAWSLTNASALQIRNAGLMGYSNSAYLTANLFNSSGTWKYIATNAATLYSGNSGAHEFYVSTGTPSAGATATLTQAMTLDASGNLLVGTTSTTPANANGSIIWGGTDAGIMYLERTTGTDQLRFYVGGNRLGYLNTASSAVTLGTANYPLVFATNDTERARITSAGDLLVGTTSTPAINVKGSALQNFANQGRLAIGATVSNADLAYFYSSTALAGAINVNGSVCTYTSFSDYRLKEDVAPMTGALTKVAALKPVTYKWKTDGSAGQGFIAHELQAVVPECVTGEKDAVDEEGNPKYQGIDTSFLVATLTAAIQELKAEFDAYKASHP